MYIHVIKAIAIVIVFAEFPVGNTVIEFRFRTAISSRTTEPGPRIILHSL
jgi:hypothetical protein